eukprot:TRINITY_DN291_c0_g1_i1.p1 TRINITY_DN291_c0_g1~~TRINITY_DN291_c0_g1_i1.p1  ORF type:complete len:295 (+),score=34.64 TRINITY_DN291_c0_g1_i1:46-885(+)
MATNEEEEEREVYDARNYSKGLKKEIVLVTGASSGIGEETAKQFARAGAKVIMVARRKEKLERIKEKLVEEGVKEERVKLIELDVREGREVGERLGEESLGEEFREITILVNNAGLAIGKALTHLHTDEMINGMIDTNVKGALFVIRAVVPKMIERKRGHIVNVSSIAGLESYVGGAVYCASKAAFQAINNSLRKELVSTPLRVCSICPGLVDTNFSLVRFNGDLLAAKSAYLGLLPLLASDISDNILYICSRPPHVQISELIVFPTSQASSEIVYRQT